MAINSLSASSYGLSGLVSGMDTQTMVEKLLSGTQSKIDKAMQKKTQLQYKQNMYREVAAKLRTLQSSYLSFTSSTNLLSSSFYNTMKTTVTAPGNTSPAFSVTASSSASVGNVTMNYIKQLATARTEKTTQDASDKVEGKLNSKSAKALLDQYTGEDAVMTITVDGKSVRINDATVQFSGMSQSEVATYLNDRFAASGIAAEARYTNNKLSIVADNSDAFITITGNTNTSADDSTLAMRMFGGGVSNLAGKGSITSSIDTDLYNPSFTVDLDGSTKTIHMDLTTLKEYVNAPDDATADAKAQQLVDGIQTQLQRYFGAGVKATLSGGTLSFSSGTASQTFRLNGDSSVMGMMGMKDGISNKLNTNLAIKDLNFANKLQGNQHTFTINGVQFSYDSDTQLSQIIQDVNASKAGVTISYSESEDRFVVKSATTGAGTVGFEASQTEGNLLSVLFGTAGGNSANGYGVNMQMVAEEAVKVSDIAYGGTYTFNVNGADVKFTVSTKNAMTMENFVTKMNNAFRDTYGYMSDGTQTITFDVNDEGKFVITANDSNYVVKATEYNKDTNTHSLGFDTSQATRAFDGDITLEQAGIQFGTNASINISFGSHNISIASSEFGEGTTMQEMADLMTQKIRGAMGIAAGDTTTAHPKVEYDEKTASFKVTGYNDGTQDVPMTISIDEGTATTPYEFTMDLLDVDGLGTNLTISLSDSEMLGMSKNQIAALINEKISEQMNSSDASVVRPTVTWDETSQAFVLDSGSTASIGSQAFSGEQSSVNLENLFGQMSLSVNQPGDDTFREVTDVGKNAVFSLNGTEIERSSNSFTIDGLTYTLNTTTVTSKELKAGLDASTMTAEELADHTNYDYDYTGDSTISVNRDTEQIMEGIKEFIKLYNETIDYINELYKAEATYKDYAPLTDDQKSSMSDREIELWEEKAQEGLLRNDMYLERALSGLRTAMYTKPAGSNIAIYDLGLSTSYYSNDGNFTVDSWDKLQSMLENDPESVQQLFAGEGGIMELVNTAINDATKSSYSRPGYLVSVAGSNTLDTSSNIYKQIAEIDEQMVTLENRYWNEYNRYWKQFNTMEQLIAQMNSQSGYLAQMMGG